jgi:hypothetical protein
MQAGYTIEYGSKIGGETIIECINYSGLNTVKFYYWHDQIGGLTRNTVAIFKIKPKTK